MGKNKHIKFEADSDASAASAPVSSSNSSSSSSKNNTANDTSGSSSKLVKSHTATASTAPTKPSTPSSSPKKRKHFLSDSDSSDSETERKAEKSSKKAKTAKAAPEYNESEGAAAESQLIHDTRDNTRTSFTNTTNSDNTESSSSSSEAGPVSLLLFYQYVRPPWTNPQRMEAECFTRSVLSENGCTGRLRVANEGFNGTLTGSSEGIRTFCTSLRKFDPTHFEETDFKIVDGLKENQRLKGLKVWHVDELVTYGLRPSEASIEHGGTHLSPEDWHAKAHEPNTVIIDVRNANESAIGRFAPKGNEASLLDPGMRVSTEFPNWVSDNMDKLKDKNVLMYCTGGIRCERASAILVEKGLDKVFQLEGGIHRYLDAFPEGGCWVGKNYTFDKRFAHAGAEQKENEVVGRCACCAEPWERYQAHRKCVNCRMEVLVCRTCERSGEYKQKRLLCWLCGGPKPAGPAANTIYTAKKFEGKKKKWEMKAKGTGDF